VEEEILENSCEEASSVQVGKKQNKEISPCGCPPVSLLTF